VLGATCWVLVQVMVLGAWC